MTLNCKEVEAELYGYERKAGDTGKNLVADMLKEIANALGFDITLLKEDRNPNKAFCFQEEDVDIIAQIMKLAKSKEGKRLRCRDYKGAGIECVDEAIEAFALLAIHAGVSKERVNLEIRRMHESSGQLILLELIRYETDEYDEDLAEHFFAPIGNCQEDDHMDEVDRQVFLEFLYGNRDEDPSDIRGIYWFFKEEKEETEHNEFMKEVNKIKKLPQEGIDELKDFLMRRMKLEQVLVEDDEYNKRLDEWIDILEGKGKLQDNRHLKGMENKLRSIRDEHIQEVFEIVVEVDDLKSTSAQCKSITADEEERYRVGQFQLESAIAKYMAWKAYRKIVPVTKDNETMREIMYKQRFKAPMCLLEG